MRRVLEIRVGAAGDALDRFEAAWNRVAEGRPLQPLRVLTLDDLPALLKTLSPARCHLVEILRKAGPLSIYELSKRLERNYKNVHTDVTQLVEVGVIDRGEDGLVSVPWDLLRAELSF
jgi:predicted transcriptional regulator